MAKVCGHYYLAYLFYASATQYRPFFPSPLIPAGAVAAPATLDRHAFTLKALYRNSRQHQHQSLPECMLVLVVFCQLPQTPTMHERNKHCMHGTAPATTNNTGVVRQCLARSRVIFVLARSAAEGNEPLSPTKGLPGTAGHAQPAHPTTKSPRAHHGSRSFSFLRFRPPKDPAGALAACCAFFSLAALS